MQVGKNIFKKLHFLNYTLYGELTVLTVSSLRYILEGRVCDNVIVGRLIFCIRLTGTASHRCVFDKGKFGICFPRCRYCVDGFGIVLFLRMIIYFQLFHHFQKCWELNSKHNQ